MTRCYVCNAEPQDGCQGIDGERSECPRPSAPASTPAPKRRVRNCPRGRIGADGKWEYEHTMVPDWQGRYFTHTKCRWCNHREAV